MSFRNVLSGVQVSVALAILSAAGMASAECKDLVLRMVDPLCAIEA